MVAGYSYGAGVFRDDCDPTPLDGSSREWPLPHYDGAKRRLAPPDSAPGTNLTRRWEISGRHRRPSPPIVNNGSAFVIPDSGATDRLVAYDLYSGDGQWLEPTAGTPNHRTVLSGGDTVFLPYTRTDDDRVTRALATADGSERWTATSNNPHATGTIHGGRFVTSDGDDVVALDASSGAECWRTSVDVRPWAFAVDDDGLLVVNATAARRIVALDAETGRQRWERDVTEHLLMDDDDINDAVRTRTVIGDEYVYAYTWGGRLLALDVETGSTDWVATSSTPEPIEDGQRTYAPARLKPAAYTGDLLLAIDEDVTDTPDALYALDPSSGDAEWVYEPEAGTLQLPAVAGEVVYLPTSDELHLVDLGDGTVLETHDVEGYSRSVALAEGFCLLLTSEEFVSFEAG